MAFFQPISYIYLWPEAQKHISLRKTFKLLKRDTKVAKATHILEKKKGRIYLFRCCKLAGSATNSSPSLWWVGMTQAQANMNLKCFGRKLFIWPGYFSAIYFPFTVSFVLFCFVLKHLPLTRAKDRMLAKNNMSISPSIANLPHLGPKIWDQQHCKPQH